MMYTMPKNLLSICVNFTLATQPPNRNAALGEVLVGRRDLAR